MRRRWREHGSASGLLGLGLVIAAAGFLAVALSGGSTARTAPPATDAPATAAVPGASVPTPVLGAGGTTTAGSTAAGAPARTGSTGTATAPGIASAPGTATAPVTAATPAGATTPGGAATPTSSPGPAAVPVPAGSPGSSSGLGSTALAVGAPLPGIRPVGADFLGLSLEYQELLSDTGTNPAAPDPAFVRLIDDLSPGRRPLLRIGGDSTDWSWLPIPDLHRVRGEKVELTRTRLAMLGSLGRAVDARFILGINLEADSTALAAAEAGALLRAVGAGHVSAFELGNEPELYDVLGWYADRHHHAVLGRRRPYTVSRYADDYARIAAAVDPTVPLAGPAVGVPRWLGNGLRRFIAGERRLALVTVHAYPLKLCGARVGGATYPTIERLLSPTATTGIVAREAPVVAVAHAAGLPIRVDEINSVSCKGAPGVSDTLAAALWTLETLLDFARAGVDGVNMATLPRSAYRFWTFQGDGTATVNPDYYGMLDFVDSVPPGSRFLAVPGAGAALPVYAIRTPGGAIRVIAVNTGATTRVTLTIPGAAGPAQVAYLRGPGLAATGGLTLAGRAFARPTATGRLTGSPRVTVLAARAGRFSLAMPAGSAATLTVG